jgi:hypothetical protein
MTSQPTRPCWFYVFILYSSNVSIVFLFVRSRLKISVPRLNILTVGFHNFPRCFQRNTGMKISNYTTVVSFHILSNSLMNNHIIRRCILKVVLVLKELSTMPWRRMGEWMYSSTFTWSQHYLEMSGQFHAPAALSPEKERPVPIGLEVGWTPEPVWTTWRRENAWPYRDSNSDPSFVQPVASRYTDYSLT